MVAQVLGGVGLFLVGMLLVTDGLRAAAGDALQRFLLRFTGGPVKAVLSGIAVTALVQSSSATTVATIAFVGAGLLTFEQAVGVIFGANIGTTATGWIVALLGLKVDMTTYALPVVGVGALARLFLRGRLANLGLALAGFGVFFVGIDVLQAGMTDLSARVTPDALPGDDWGGRITLVGLGVAMTTVMQSSSAAVATALTALHSGTISLQQAAALVIGINIGTTVTAGLAAFGGSTAAKRTAFAHLLFNGLTGALAFAVLPGFVWAVEHLGEHIGNGDATILIATFHTAFNLLGVALILPFTSRFSAMVKRAIRHRGPHLTRLLDPRAARQGSLATEAVRQTVIEIARVLFGAVDTLLARGQLVGQSARELDAAAAALHDTEAYVATLKFVSPLPDESHRRYVSTIHAIDHLGRLVDAALEGAPAAADGPEVRSLVTRTREALAALTEWAHDTARTAPVDSLRHLHEEVASSRRALRAALLARTADGVLSPVEAGAQIERLRWLEGLVHQLYRLADRLRGERLRDVPTELDVSEGDEVGKRVA